MVPKLREHRDRTPLRHPVQSRQPLRKRPPPQRLDQIPHRHERVILRPKVMHDTPRLTQTLLHDRQRHLHLLRPPPLNRPRPPQDPRNQGRPSRHRRERQHHPPPIVRDARDKRREQVHRHLLVPPNQVRLPPFAHPVILLVLVVIVKIHRTPAQPLFRRRQNQLMPHEPVRLRILQIEVLPPRPPHRLIPLRQRLPHEPLLVIDAPLLARMEAVNLRLRDNLRQHHDQPRHEVRLRRPVPSQNHRQRVLPPRPHNRLPTRQPPPMPRQVLPLVRLDLLQRPQERRQLFRPRTSRLQLLDPCPHVHPRRPEVNVNLIRECDLRLRAHAIVLPTPAVYGFFSLLTGAKPGP